MATFQGPDVQGSDEQEEMFCEVCRKKGRSRPAEGFCVDCVRYFCSACLEYHTEFLPNHVQKDKSSMPQEVCLKPCSMHGDEIIKFYCRTCDTFFCDVCKEKSHESCSSVTHLPQLVEETDLNEKYGFTMRSIEKFLDKICMKEDMVCKKAESADTLAAEAKRNLIVERDKVRAWLDGRFVTLDQKISQLEAKNKNFIQTEKNELHLLKSKLESLAADLRGSKEANNKIDRFMSLCLVQRRLRPCISHKVETHNVSQYKFIEKEGLEDTLKDLSLGRVQEIPDRIRKWDLIFRRKNYYSLDDESI